MTHPPGYGVFTPPYQPLGRESIPYHDRGTVDVRWMRPVDEERTLLTLVNAYINYRELGAFKSGPADRSSWRLDDLLRLRDTVDVVRSGTPITIIT